MDKIAVSLETVCAVSIIAGITGALIPSGKLKSAYLSFCAVVLIFSFVESVSGINAGTFSDITADSEKAESELSSQVDKSEEQLYENILGSALEEKLTEINCRVSVKADCVKSDDGYDTVLLTVSGKLYEKQKSDAEKYLKESFPSAEIRFEETGDE